MSGHCVLQEHQNSQSETNSNEETTNRTIPAILKEKHTNREIRNYNSKQPHTTDFIRRGGECEIQMSDCQSQTEKLS